MLLRETIIWPYVVTAVSTPLPRSVRWKAPTDEQLERLGALDIAVCIWNDAALELTLPPSKGSERLMNRDLNNTFDYGAVRKATGISMECCVDEAFKRLTPAYAQQPLFEEDPAW